MKVNEVMNKAFAIEASLNIKQAAKIMSDKKIGSLIVLKNNKIAGIITERDILGHISNLNMKVSAVMAKQVITIDHSRSIDDAAQLMTKEGVKRLPVIDKDKLVGIITGTDIIANSDLLNEEFMFG